MGKNVLIFLLLKGLFIVAVFLTHFIPRRNHENSGDTQTTEGNKLDLGKTLETKVWIEKDCEE